MPRAQKRDGSLQTDDALMEGRQVLFGVSQVSSRPGGEQVTKRSLGACMQHAAEEQSAKRGRVTSGSGAVEALAAAACVEEDPAVPAAGAS